MKQKHRVPSAAPGLSGPGLGAIPTIFQARKLVDDFKPQAYLKPQAQSLIQSMESAQSEAILGQNKREATGVIGIIEGFISSARGWANELSALKGTLNELVKQPDLARFENNVRVVTGRIDEELKRVDDYVRQASAAIETARRVAQTGQA